MKNTWIRGTSKRDAIARFNRRNPKKRITKIEQDTGLLFEGRTNSFKVHYKRAFWIHRVWNDIKYFFLTLFDQNRDVDVDYKEVIGSILKRRGYVVSASKGSVVYSKGFVYVIVGDDVKLGHDIPSNTPQRFDLYELSRFTISLNYMERI